MESCPEARDLGGFNLLADKAALGGEEASLAARRSRFSIELLLSLLILLLLLILLFIIPQNNVLDSYL